MMANTAMFGLSVPLAPVTLAFGPTVTWALILTLGMAASRRLLVLAVSPAIWAPRPVAAAIGAGSPASGRRWSRRATPHPNLAVLFVLPLIIGQLLKLRTGERTVRTGVVLGLLTAYQVFLGEEALLLCAVGIGLFAVAYAIFRPRDGGSPSCGCCPGSRRRSHVFLVLGGFPAVVAVRRPAELSRPAARQRRQRPPAGCPATPAGRWPATSGQPKKEFCSPVERQRPSTAAGRRPATGWRSRAARRGRCRRCVAAGRDSSAGRRTATQRESHQHQEHGDRRREPGQHPQDGTPTRPAAGKIAYATANRPMPTAHSSSASSRGTPGKR